MPAKPTPKPTPTPKPACPESPPAVGTPCTNAMTCSYADYSDACGFTPTEVECSGGTWSESDTGTCTSGSSCNPLGTWSIDAEPAGPDEWCGTNGPPSKVSVLPGPNGSLKSEWDASVSADGCKLHLHDYYEYDQYETGSESRDSEARHQRRHGHGHLQLRWRRLLHGRLQCEGGRNAREVGLAHAVSGEPTRSMC